MEAIIGKEFPKKIIPLIEGSTQTIDIVVFDWRWYPNEPANPVQLFNQSLVRAVRRGVKVRAIVNNDEVLETLKSCGVLAKRLFAKSLLHAKLMIIDQKIVIIGSHNYTQSAFTMNCEISAMFSDLEAATQFLDFFESLWQL